MHVDDVGLRIEMMVPDLLEQHGARHDMSGVPHEVFEQPKLARQDLDLPARAAHRPLQ